MNRRDFAKTSVGGFLALLVPGRVLAEAKPDFPRYFRPTGRGRRYCITPLRYIRVESETGVFHVRPGNSQNRAFRPYALKALEDGRVWPKGFVTLESVLRDRDLGMLFEITAAEAKALLKPKTVVAWKATCPGPSTIDPADFHKPQRYPLGAERNVDGSRYIYCKAGSGTAMREGVLTCHLSPNG